MSKNNYFALIAILCVMGCQKFDFSKKDDKGKESSSSIIIYGSGEGTKERPYTVDNILKGQISSPTTGAWIIGYAVGTTYRTLSNATFSASTTYASSILLSNDSLCTDISNCIPVELSSSKTQSAFSIPSSPARIRQCLLIQGTIRTYFGVPGLRDIQDGYWLFGFDTQALDSSPQEWETNSFTFYGK